MVCSICYESFTSPTSLPCGHVFCRECIRRAVHSTKHPCSAARLCPTCRRPFGILTIDPALIPPYLRPHILPSVRPLFLDDAESPAQKLSSADALLAVSPTASASTELARAHAELASLRLSCATWRRRAEVHAAANHGLLTFARAAKDCALRLRTERDAARGRCALLKRTLCEAFGPAPDAATAFALATDKFAFVESDAVDAAADAARAASEARARGGLPVYLMLPRPAEHYYDDPRNMEASHFGPPMKRRRRGSEASSSTGSASAPPTPTPGSTSSASECDLTPPNGSAARPLSAPPVPTPAPIPVRVSLPGPQTTRTRARAASASVSASVSASASLPLGAVSAPASASASLPLGAVANVLPMPCI